MQGKGHGFDLQFVPFRDVRMFRLLCSMTFYFSFEVFVTFDPIQVNIGLHRRLNEAVLCLSSLYWKMQYGSVNWWSIILQVRVI